MTSGPVVPMVWEGFNVIKTGRKMLGETNPRDSAPGTIRGDFCVQVSYENIKCRFFLMMTLNILLRLVGISVMDQMELKLLIGKYLYGFKKTNW